MATSARAPNPEHQVERLLSDIKTKVDWLAITDEEIEQLGVFEDSYDREEWRWLDRFLRTEYDERRRENARLRFQGAIRNALIYNWLQKNTNVKSEWESKRIADTVWTDLRDDARENLTEYLCDVVTLGLDKADEKRKKAKVGRWYWGLIVWTVLVALVRLALVFGIVESAQNKFETIVLAMLVLTYIGVQDASRQESYLHLLRGAQSECLFNRVLLKVKYQELEWERDRRIHDERDTTEKLARIPVPYSIQGLSFGLVWLFAMYKIVAAIFF